ncbi:MAG: hypothetical protein J6D06_07840 [Clostridia bacterium]|nr:hypothetical protein [Clostridia bacterium]
MDFFNSLIAETYSLIDGLDKKSFDFEMSDAWQDVGYNEVILQRDTAFELEGVGFNLITTAPVNDEIVVIGEDLSHIYGNRKFTRVCVIELEETEDQQKTYNLIRKVEYTKYHVFPKGYMIRTTSRSHKEAVRVSGKAVKDGISFKKIGNLLIKKYKENPAVKGVKVIFVTDAGADFKHFEEIARKNNDITETLNHIMNSVNFDCDTCKLKPICDEVEGMKELHFKTSGKKED